MFWAMLQVFVRILCLEHPDRRIWAIIELREHLHSENERARAVGPQTEDSVRARVVHVLLRNSAPWHSWSSSNDGAVIMRAHRVAASRFPQRTRNFSAVC